MLRTLSRHGREQSQVLLQDTGLPLKNASQSLVLSFFLIWQNPIPSYCWMSPTPATKMEKRLGNKHLLPWQSTIQATMKGEENQAQGCHLILSAALRGIKCLMPLTPTLIPNPTGKVKPSKVHSSWQETCSHTVANFCSARLGAKDCGCAGLCGERTIPAGAVLWWSLVRVLMAIYQHNE